MSLALRSTLIDVGQSEWSHEPTGLVIGGTDRCMSWWFHPNRHDEHQKYVERVLRTAEEVSVIYSTAHGATIRDSQWKDRRGWDHHHHAETLLTAEGLPALNGDRFVAPVSDIKTLISPSGEKWTITCDGRIEFTPLANGDTEIRHVHRHTMVGGTWLQRWSYRKAERKNTNDLFWESIVQCRAEVGHLAT
jgi:hypothetical protein